LQDLFRVCDRIAVMYEGQSVDDEPIGDLDIESLVGLITRTGVPADPDPDPDTQQEATA
jgi:simple sugar transport system ATP-binding protein